MKMNMMTKKQTAAAGTCAGVFHAERSLARVVPWGLNPRHDEESEIEELKADLLAHGLQDAIHVWERPEGDLILKGHRRFRAMTSLGWSSCKQVVHEFADEAGAFAYLLADHGHTVGLSPEEKVLAVERGVKLGLDTVSLAGPMGISPERVQLLWDIGEGLPPRGREALHEGWLSLATAEVIVQVADAKDRARAVQLVLHDVVTQEPLSPGAARNLIESEFILPAKWQKAWTKLEAKLRKELKVSDGYHYVPWGERLEYVQGWSGQPQPGYELAEARGARQVQTFGEQARQYGVPVYVVPAPQHKAEHVLVVSVRMLREAAAAEQRNDEGGMTNEECGMTNEATDDDPQIQGGPQILDEALSWPGRETFKAVVLAAFPNMNAEKVARWLERHPLASIAEIGRGMVMSKAEAVLIYDLWQKHRGEVPVSRPVISEALISEAKAMDEESRKMERLRVWLKTWLGAIFEALVASPTECMGKTPWEPLMPFVARLAVGTRAERPGIALLMWRGAETADEALSGIYGDGRPRWYLREPLMHLLCLAHDSCPLEEGEALIREVASALGIDGKALEAKVEEALRAE